MGSGACLPEGQGVPTQIPLLAVWLVFYKAMFICKAVSDFCPVVLRVCLHPQGHPQQRYGRDEAWGPELRLALLSGWHRAQVLGSSWLPPWSLGAELEGSLAVGLLPGPALWR